MAVINMDDGIKLLRQFRKVIMAHALALRQIEHAYGALQAREI